MADRTILAIPDPTSRGEQPVVERAARPNAFEPSLPHSH